MFSLRFLFFFLQRTNVLLQCNKGGERTLIKREKEILQAIIDYIEQNEYVPSVREICEIVGLKSTSTVHGHLTNLESNGSIERKENSPRTLKVLKTD